MIRSGSMLFMASVLFVTAGCSKRERSDPDAEEWQSIQALADETADVSTVKKETTTEKKQAVPLEDFSSFVQRLEEMKAVDRKEGQTLLTGERLVFDQERRFVRMDEDVIVEDDQGVLETESLIGRFSSSNTLDYVEAQNGVVIRNEGREASADEAIYDYATGLVQLDGHATVFEGENRLSGERIELWMQGNRMLICEPNAVLEISGENGLKTGGSSVANGGTTEIRADKVVFDQNKGMAELFDNVRVRDSRGAMNCDLVRLYLKEDNKLDWIEAVSEVIIQSVDRKALADRATFHADEGKFVLEGNPKVKQGLNVMTGDRIIFWHENRRMVCEPNARVLLYLDEETKAKFLKDLDD